MNKRKTNAFTLLELVIVIAIISVMMTVLWSVYNVVKTQADKGEIHYYTDIEIDYVDYEAILREYGLLEGLTEEEIQELIERLKGNE